MKKADKILFALTFIGMMAMMVLAYHYAFIIPKWFPSLLSERLFIAVCTLWLLSESLNFIYGLRNAKDIEEERISVVMLLATELSLIVAVIVAGYVTYDFTEDKYHLIAGDLQYVGILLMLFGILLRELSIITLKKAFTTSIHLKNETKVVDRGMYRYIRHPSYTGAILSLTGLPLAYGAWFGAVIVFSVAMSAYFFRIEEEEKMLIKKYGNAYVRYMKSTWRLFPGY